MAQWVIVFCGVVAAVTWLVIAGFGVQALFDAFTGETDQ